MRALMVIGVMALVLTCSSSAQVHDAGVGGGAAAGGGGGMSANGLCYTPYGGMGGADYRRALRFVTSLRTTGDLGGIDGANEKCRRAAAAAGVRSCADDAHLLCVQS